MGGEEQVESDLGEHFVHHYFKNLNAEVVETFKQAYAISVIGKEGRISTERFLAALPEEHRRQMQQIANESDYHVDLDMPRPRGEIDPDWQRKMLFSNCVENALLESMHGNRKGLHGFLKILSTTAVAFQNWHGEGTLDARFSASSD